MSPALQEAVIVAWYTRVGGAAFSDLTLPNRPHRFRNAFGGLNTYHRISEEDIFAAEEAGELPDVCMCGKVFSADGARLRFFCRDCRHEWHKNRWAVFDAIRRTTIAVHTICSIDPALIPALLAKAIWLEAVRQENVKRLQNDSSKNAPTTESLIQRLS